MPNTIAYMEDGTSSTVGAFAGASNLKAVSMSKNLETIGAYAFSNCIKIKEVNLDNVFTVRGYT